MLARKQEPQELHDCEEVQEPLADREPDDEKKHE
jgi:hypothetical protein